MRKIIVIPTVRPEMMKIFLDSLDYLPDWDVFATFEGYDQAGHDILKSSRNYKRIVNSFSYAERLPPWPIRVQMIDNALEDGYEIFCSADDDMEYLKTVDYEPMVKMCQDFFVGIVEGNWVKSKAMHKEPKREFIRQPIIYTGGGLVFDKKIAKLLCSEPRKPYLFDDVQAGLITYVNGYENLRYRGSVIVHKILQRDGLRATHHLMDFELPDAELLRCYPTKSKMYQKDNNYTIPQTKDLKQKAILMHNIRQVGMEINHASGAI